MNESPECRECGNRVKFVHRNVETELCYYNEHGEVYDSKSVHVFSSVIVECGECGADMSGDPEPTCDICNVGQYHSEHMEWNGETGNHVRCEQVEYDTVTDFSTLPEMDGE